ncbi:MAG: TRAP transporter substrate-binding protein [Proteobacteria bacterium]|nr:TRAP transporter substrate-binding protein [Pseudomonadota bacterium]
MNFRFTKNEAAALALATGLTLAALPAGAQTKWDFPTPYPDGNYHTQNVREFAAEVEKATGGKFGFTVHSNASLVKMPEMKRAVQSGQVSIGEVLISVLANEDAMFGFESVPGLAPSYAEAMKLHKLAQPYIAARLEKQGMMYLYSVVWPPQGIYTKKPITALADLKGTKFRSYNPATARFAQLVGAVSTTIQVPEVPQAFRTGVLDAMITSGSTGIDTQAWDYLSHYYDTQAFLPQNLVFVNKTAFDKLPADIQAAVKDAAAKAEARGWKKSEELNEQYKKTLAEKGIKVAPATDAMKAEIKAIGETMAKEWAEKAGADGAKLVSDFRK